MDARRTRLQLQAHQSSQGRIIKLKAASIEILANPNPTDR
jgi:hypothetical protein